MSLNKPMQHLTADQVSRLLESSIARLTTLTHTMLRQFPRVNRWNQTGDVMSIVAERLMTTIRNTPIQSERHFFALAAQNIRWTLLDLARQYSSGKSFAAYHETLHGNADEYFGTVPDNNSIRPDELSRWTAFHEAVDALPENTRQTVDFIWYHALSYKEIADLLNVSERTIRARWVQARLQLFELLGSDPPN